jgi:hypothetical protein
MKERGLPLPVAVPGVHARGCLRHLRRWEAPVEAYDGPQIVGMDLHRRRSVLVRMAEDGRKLATARITNSPGAAGRRDQAGGPAPPGGAGGLLRLVLGGGRRGAPGPPARGEGLQPPPGQERRARRPRPGRPAADGPAGRGVDRPGGDPRAPRDHQVPRQAGTAADQLQGPGPRRAGQARHRGDLPGASSASGEPSGWTNCRCPSPTPGRSPRCGS